MTRAPLLRLLFILPTLACAYRTHADASHSGRWWLAAPREERLGYLAGYIDCATTDAGKQRLAVGWYSLEPKITKYYGRGASVVARPAWEILKELAAAEPANPSNRGGESYPGKHGMFDGEYWRQSPPDHRLGFIEGYLDCRTVEEVSGVRYSKATAAYVARLSEWFGIEADDPSEVRADRAEVKIADALHLFRDQ